MKIDTFKWQKLYGGRRIIKPNKSTYFINHNTFQGNFNNAVSRHIPCEVATGHFWRWADHLFYNPFIAPFNAHSGVISTAQFRDTILGDGQRSLSLCADQFICNPFIRTLGRRCKVRIVATHSLWGRHWSFSRYADHPFYDPFIAPLGAKSRVIFTAQCWRRSWP